MRWPARTPPGDFNRSFRWSAASDRLVFLDYSPGFDGALVSVDPSEDSKLVISGSLEVRDFDVP